MKTKLQAGSPPALLREALDGRFRGKDEAAALLQIPLFRLQKACRGDLGALTTADWRKIAPILPTETRDALRAAVIP